MLGLDSSIKIILSFLFGLCNLYMDHLRAWSNNDSMFCMHGCVYHKERAVIEYSQPLLCYLFIYLLIYLFIYKMMETGNTVLRSI